MLLSDEKIFLRPFLHEDYIFINKLRNDPKVQRWVVGSFRSVSLEIEKEWVHSKMMENVREKYWAVCKQDEAGTMVGWVSLNDIDQLNQNLQLGGITLSPYDEWDPYICYRVLKLIVEYAFEEMNMHCIYGDYLSGHPYAQHMNYGVGFTVTGCKKDFVYKHGQYWDDVIFSMNKTDYEKKKEQGEFTIEKMYRRAMWHLCQSKKNVKRLDCK